MTEPVDDVPAFELVMPFVACQSQGGTYADDSFVAGWRLAEVHAALTLSGGCWQGNVQDADLAQLDLIAMKHDATVALADPDDDSDGTTWRFATITRWATND